jgi:hypothetical protein
VNGAIVIRYAVAEGLPDNEFASKLIHPNAAAKFFKISFATLTTANTGANLCPRANVKTRKDVDRVFNTIQDSALEVKEVLQAAKEVTKNKERACCQIALVGPSGPVSRLVKTKSDRDRELVSTVKLVKTVRVLVLR